MRRHFFLSFLLPLLSLLFWRVPPAGASNEFSTSFTSTYTLKDHGLTEVVHQIEITNKLAHIYTTEYTLAVGSDRVSHIKTFAGGAIAPSLIDQQGASTTITLTIPHPTIGYGQTTSLEIRYTTPDIATALGNTLQVNIPRLSKGNEAESYKRIVRLPQNTPALTSVSPTFQEKHPEDNYIVYTFSGHGNDSISMLFGESLTYELDLTYEISNPGLGASHTEIALPPDTPYQQAMLAQIDPAPSEIVLDGDGNWLARYNLKSQEKMVIHAKVYLTVSAVPRYHDPSVLAGNLTAPTDYWESKKPTVTELALQLKTPRNIYDYLVGNFTYNYNRVKIGTERLGAAKALSSPSDVLCTEFTDTFIALARSLNLPTREINGYAYSDNTLIRPLSLQTDVLHSWVEYYDEPSKTWKSADPTWGHTTGGINYFDLLDFNHLTFVRRGAEATYPLPAGVYKTSGPSKQVEVKIADLPPATTGYRIDEVGEKLVLTNTGNVAMINQVVSSRGEEFKVSYLQPLGKLVLSHGSGGLSANRRAIPLVLIALALPVAVVIFYRRRKKVLR